MFLIVLIDYGYRRDYSRYKADKYPVKHRRKVPFAPSLRLGPEYRYLLKQIRGLEQDLDSMVLSDTDYLELVSEAFTSNIHWSVALEGNPMTEEEVRRVTGSFFDGEVDDSPYGHVQEILNHLHSFFWKDELSLPWRVGAVSTVHSLLTQDVGRGYSPGILRTVFSSIEGGDGFEYFHTCPPEHILTELDSLLDWLNHSPYDEIVTAALFFHEFQSIHPFTDGNGRTGRTLFHLLLQELGLPNSKLCMIEKHLLQRPAIYYNLLAYTDQMNDYEPFVMYVTESILKAYEEAFGTLKEKDVLSKVDEVSRQLVIRSKRGGWFTLGEAVTWSGGLSEQSVSRRLRDLQGLGVIEKTGRTKATRFRFKTPFQDLKERSMRRFHEQATLDGL